MLNESSKVKRRFDKCLEKITYGSDSVSSSKFTQRNELQRSSRTITVDKKPAVTWLLTKLPALPVTTAEMLEVTLGPVTVPLLPTVEVPFSPPTKVVELTFCTRFPRRLV